MTQYLIFSSPKSFLRECKSLSAAWTVMLLFEDLEPKLSGMNSSEINPPKWVQEPLTHVYSVRPVHFSRSKNNFSKCSG